MSRIAEDEYKDDNTSVLVGNKVYKMKNHLNCLHLKSNQSILAMNKHDLKRTAALLQDNLYDLCNTTYYQWYFTELVITDIIEF